MKTSIIFVLAVAGIGSACVVNERRDAARPSSTTTVSGAQVVSNDRAVARIAEARCDREVACDNVGDGHRWASKTDCLNDVRGDLRDKLSSDDCPNGVDERHLNECLKDARTERCGNPLDSIGRSSSCGKSELCLGK
jgi:hypothetical protein